MMRRIVRMCRMLGAASVRDNAFLREAGEGLRLCAESLCCPEWRVRKVLATTSLVISDARWTRDLRARC